MPQQTGYAASAAGLFLRGATMVDVADALGTTPEAVAAFVERCIVEGVCTGGDPN
jgi:hypothetical protein